MTNVRKSSIWLMVSEKGFVISSASCDVSPSWPCPWRWEQAGLAVNPGSCRAEAFCQKRSAPAPGRNNHILSKYISDNNRKMNNALIKFSIYFFTNVPIFIFCMLMFFLLCYAKKQTQGHRNAGQRGERCETTLTTQTLVVLDILPCCSNIQPW